MTKGVVQCMGMSMFYLLVVVYKIKNLKEDFLVISYMYYGIQILY